MSVIWLIIRCAAAKTLLVTDLRLMVDHSIINLYMMSLLFSVSEIISLFLLYLSFITMVSF